VRELEVLERQGWEALSGVGGAEFYADLMADDGLMVFPGMVLSKAETIRAIAAAPPWAEFHLEDVRVVDAGPDIGIVAYQATARRDGEAPYRAFMTSTFVRRDARWQLVLHQQSPAPGSAADT